jgi:L-asparaginase II
MCDAEPDSIPVGIDGCSAPNFGLPLSKLAIGFQRLAAGTAPAPEMAAAVQKIRDAMLAFPEMISGEKRFDLALARSFPGNLVCKVGAEATEAIGLTDPSIGICVKIHDGSWRALGAVVVEILRQLGILGEIERYPELVPHLRPEVKNNRGIVTGHVIPDFRLREVLNA